MVQQTIDSKFSEYGLGSTEANLSTRNKQFSLTVKKTALRDVQNENRIPSSLLSKDVEAMKVSGTKRSSPEGQLSPNPCQSPSSTAANAHLVYVRRKSELEIGKSTTCESKSVNADSRHPDQPVDNTQPRPELKEPKVSSFPAFAPMPMASFMSASAKPSVPTPFTNSGKRFATPESNHHPDASAVVPSPNTQKGIKNMPWEERYRQLHVSLRKLDESDHEDYVQTLRSLSSVELSRHAVELEKRAIYLALEEAKELQRAAALNVLGKSMKNSIKEPLSDQDHLENKGS